MLARVAEIITRYSMFQTGQRVGVAVSGGADSVCLLHVLTELAPRWNLRLSVLHLDHQLRGEESREDARFVQELAERLGLPFNLGEVDVGRVARETGDNLEQAARNERRRFFLDYLRSGAADRIAIGHTRSDQAETVLFRFLRGSGTAGLAGIRPATAEGFVRPLLEIDRASIEQFLRERNIAWREDSSNARLDFARNRIRRELLPALARDWNPAIAETLAHTAEWAREEEAYWEVEIDRLAAAHLTVRPPAVFLRADSVTGLPIAAARRLARRAVERVRGDLLGIDFGHITAILALAAQPEGHGRLQVPGVDVFRSFEWLRLAPPGMDNLENRNYRFPAPVPGSVPVPGTSSAVLLQLVENKSSTGTQDSGYNSRMEGLDWDRVPGALELRNWRPGDQYRPVGHAEEEKIKFLFQEARIPLWERRSWPVVTSGDAIIWARRFGPAANLAATPHSRMILKIEETSA
ncbi:MAG TPA: tRNA lysidine(34) synthetase TilS [Bryobacteraceae bacterium]|nr:tRNA lysidine(34) synthetase TilS [Bryobacteraceae bacterium]